MGRVRGLAPATQALALGIVRRLLIWRFGDYAIDIAVIKAEHVRCFFTQEVQRLVGSLDQAGRSERRGAAIVRCAPDVGLRSGEVARLSLDDIDWRAGTITLRHTKGRREDVLPLPATTGAAIAAYLKEERPKTRNRAVFVRHVAPRDQPVGPDLVRKTIRQAYARAGLPSADMARRLEAWLGRPKRVPIAESWLRIQADYDLWEAMQRPAPKVRRAQPATS
jgi:integrase